MIKSIRLLSFLSHQNTTLEFAPGVNVLVGPSDSGKTSIIRALRWVAENRPAGDEFRSHWAKASKTEVEVTVYDDYDSHVIWRTKGSTDNFYGLDIETFKAFGQDVPAPVKQALGLSDINIQYQLDGPFLLGDSPGAVARYLNQVVDLEDIDQAMSAAAALKRQNDADIREKENRLKELELTEAAFPDLESAEEFIEGLENLAGNKAQVDYTLALLRSLISDGDTITGQLDRIIIPDEAKLSLLIGKANQLTQVNYTRDLLEGLLEEGAELNDQRLAIADTATLAPAVQVLMVKVDELNKKNAYILKFKMALKEYHGLAADVSRLDAIIEQGEIKLTEELGEQCPLCGSYLS